MYFSGVASDSGKLNEGEKEALGTRTETDRWGDAFEYFIIAGVCFICLCVLPIGGEVGGGGKMKMQIRVWWGNTFHNFSSLLSYSDIFLQCSSVSSLINVSYFNHLTLTLAWNYSRFFPHTPPTPMFFLSFVLLSDKQSTYCIDIQYCMLFCVCKNS